MASHSAKAGSKRPRDPSAQGLNVKFLINIPLKVDSVEQARSRCMYLLSDLLEHGFNQEERECLENIAVIFGLNGKHTEQLQEDLKKLNNIQFQCKIKHRVITYTWGPRGTVAREVPEDKIPYQNIREHLKNHPDTKSLVKELRGNDEKCLIYFSFVDCDTVNFNFVYSEYLKIVRAEVHKDKIPHTLMSTGYEFEHSSCHFIASWLDREVRAAIAEVEPLFVYYPEPNFCVLLKQGSDTIEESFVNRKNDYKMESPVLIRQVKERQDFKAVFPLSENPIIIVAPERSKLKQDGLVTIQSHLDLRNLSIGATCNQVLTHAETYNKDKPNDAKLIPGYIGKNRGFIMDLFNCQDDKEFEKLSKKNPFQIDGKPATKLIEAIKEARDYKKFVIDFNAKLPEDNC